MRIRIVWHKPRLTKSVISPVILNQPLSGWIQVVGIVVIIVWFKQAKRLLPAVP